MFFDLQEGYFYNFSDLPLWDMMFGTFRNPRQWNAACGFEPEQEQRFGAMLVGRDVNAVSAVKREGPAA